MSPRGDGDRCQNGQNCHASCTQNRTVDKHCISSQYGEKVALVGYLRWMWVEPPPPFLAKRPECIPSLACDLHPVVAESAGARSCLAEYVSPVCLSHWSFIWQRSVHVRIHGPRPWSISSLTVLGIDESLELFVVLKEHMDLQLLPSLSVSAFLSVPSLNSIL